MSMFVLPEMLPHFHECKKILFASLGRKTIVVFEDAGIKRSDVSTEQVSNLLAGPLFIPQKAKT